MTKFIELTLRTAITFAITALLFSTATAHATGFPTPQHYPPSIPEFTIKLVDHSYDVPTTTSIDKYTGRNITNPGFHVTNRSIEISIKNQLYTPYKEGNNTVVNLYYNLRVKGHFEDTWTNVYSEHFPISSGQDPFATRSDYTILSLPAQYPNGAQVDFQAEAFLGHSYYAWLPDHPLGVFSAFAVIATSGWSSTQTVTIPDPSTSASASPAPTQSQTPTPTPPEAAPTQLPTTPQSPSISTLAPNLSTPTPSIPEFPTWIILPIITATILLAALYAKRAKSP